jgi:hypothetical protein
MPILNDHYTLTLAAHYLPALFNGDYSGLDDREAADLDAFMRDYWKLPDATLDFTDAHYGRQETQFAVDEVSGLHADCYTCRLYFTNHLLNPQQHALDLN